MLRHRVIPVLLLQGGALMKTTGFKKPKYVGDPINAIRIFNDKEVDELVLLDTEASAPGGSLDFATVAEAASECFMPLAYGGGVSSRDDAERLFHLGVEKVILRTAAIRRPGLVSEIAGQAGAQSVAVCVDIAVRRFGRQRLHAPGTPAHGSSDWQQLVRSLVSAGAGEVIIQSVQRDGTQSGLDLELIAEATSLVDVPVVALGGVGSLNDIAAGISTGASAVGVGSFFVFRGPRRAVLISYPQYSDLEKLLGSA